MIAGRARGLVTRADRVTAVRVDDENLACDGVVIAVGPWCAGPEKWLGIRLPVEAVQGYRQGDGRDKSCQSAQLRRYHRGPDNRPRKESRSRQVPFLKTAPIINWPVCPW